MTRVISIIACVALLGASSALAQQRGSWRPTARVQLDVRYDDNPFLLKPSRKSSLASVQPADSQSGRFRDMDRASDLIPALALEIGTEGPGLGGRRLDLELDVSYEANVWNAARRHAEIGFQAAQALRRDGRVRLDADWRPAYFHKNYLADAVDQDLDGEIDGAERRYAGGRSHEIDVAVAYRHRLLRSRKTRRVEIMAEIAAGYLTRRYDAPFESRNRSGPGAAAGLNVEIQRRWVVGVDYALAVLGGDPAPEVLILNENDFGQDFNGNLSTSDDSARAEVLVDRSRVEHELRGSLRRDFGNTVLELTYRGRVRDFSSTQPFDVVNRDRRDARHQLGAALDVRLRAGAHLVVGARRTAQRTNRAGDPGSTGEIEDYTRHIVFAALRYRL